MTTLLAEQEEQAAEAATQTSKLRPSVIRRDGGTQVRTELNQEVIDDYKEKMEAGVEFPPPVVFEDEKGTYWLADGFYRTAAFEKAEGLGWGIMCEIRHGTQRDAVLYSLGANAAHGQPRSWEDKRRAVMTLLDDPEWTQWSNSIIAEKAQVSAPFVGKLREKLSQNVSSEGEQQPTVRRGKDNVVRDTANIGRRSDEDIEAATQIDLEKNPPLPGVDPALIQPSAPPQEGSQEGPASESETESVKVTDKRRLADSAPSSTQASPAREEKKRPSVEDLLKGRKLAVSFVWIPGVTGKVSVSVNASDKPEKASRFLIDANKIGSFPEEILSMIAEQLKGRTRNSLGVHKAATKSAKKAAPKRTAKPPTKKAPAKKKPAPKKTGAKTKKKR